MPAPRSLLRPVVAASATLVAAGCVSERRGEFIPVPPSMPIVLAASPTTPSEPAEHDLIVEALRAARAGDLDAARAQLSRLGNPVQRGRVGARIVHTLAADQPEAAARLAALFPPDPGWSAGLEAVARQLARREPDRALAWSLGLIAPDAIRVARPAVADELIAANPQDAATRIKALPASAGRDDLLIFAAASWTRRDPDAAIAWARREDDDVLREKLVSSAAFELAQAQPRRALEWAESLPESRNRWLLVSRIAQTWVAVDSPAALTWARQLPAGPARDAAFAGVDTGFGVPAARRLAGAPGTSTGSRTRGGGAAAPPGGGEMDSPDFAAWLATQPGMRSREEAILEYVRQRSASAPGGVGPLILSLPGGATRDRAMALFVENLLISSPNEAARWVQSLPLVERRPELIEKTARRWLQTNPDAAAAWLETTLLPDYQKEQLLREAGR